MIVIPGSTNITGYFFIVGDASNASPGDPVTGLDETDITTFAYTRERTVETTFAAAALASPSAAHTDGGFEEVDATNAPGLYRVDFPDAAVATGSPFARITVVVAGASNARAEPIEITLNDANAIWDAPGSSHLVAGSMGEKMAALAPIQTFVEASPTPTATVFAIDDITATDDTLIDAILVFIDGELIGQARRITGNVVNGTNVLTFKKPWIFEGSEKGPASTDRCVVIQGSVAQEVADAIWDEEIIIGHVVVDSAGERLGKLPDFVWDEIFLELAGVPAATPKARDALMWLYMKTRNKSVTDDSGSPTKHQVFNDAGTKIADSSVTDTGGGGAATRDKYV